MIIRTPSELPWSPVSHNPEILKQVFLSDGDVQGITQFARSVFQPGQVAPAHSHPDMCEVFLVTEGTLTAEVDGSIHQLEAGAVLILRPFEEHELRNESSCDLHLTYFGIRV